MRRLFLILSLLLPDGACQQRFMGGKQTRRQYPFL